MKGPGRSFIPVLGLLIFLLAACELISPEASPATPGTAPVTLPPSSPPTIQSTSTPTLDAQTIDLLARYGWSVDHRLANHTIKLPQRFQYNPGEYPTVIYWAYNNELNQAIGYDLLPYLGENIQASIYLLIEPLPEIFFPYTEARAIVITFEDQIIGAWIEKVAGFACSLDCEKVANIEAQEWREWLVSSSLVDPSSALDLELAGKTPEEIITLYYTALNAHDVQLVNALRSRRNLTYDLFSNKGELSLFNLQEQATSNFWINNIESATLLNVRELDHALGNCLPVYEAKVDFQFYDTHRPTISEGENLRFMVLNQEIKGLGWRIEEINTAPGVSQRLCEPR
jgi:hypothetical protein